MSDSHALKKYLFINQMLVAAVINFIINGLISWLSFSKFDLLTIWQQNPVYPDILLTALLLPLLSCLINSKIINSNLKTNKLAFPNALPQTNTGFHRLSITQRSFGLGFTTLLTVGIMTLVLLETVFPEGILVFQYVAFKATWSAILALVLAYPIALSTIFQHNATSKG